MFFTNAIRLFEAYYWCQIEVGSTSFDEHLAQEVRERLRQLSYLYTQIEALESELVRHEEATKGSPPPGQRNLYVFTNVGRPLKPGEPRYDEYGPASPFADHAKLRLLLESFYYVAHRIRSLLQDAHRQLPGLRTFEAPGVRDVRNHLVEHPTKKRGNTVLSYIFGGPDGPRLKPVIKIEASKPTIDQGLYRNAREFRDSFERTVGEALKEAGCGFDDDALSDQGASA